MTQHSFSCFKDHLDAKKMVELSKVFIIWVKNKTKRRTRMKKLQKGKTV